MMAEGGRVKALLLFCVGAGVSVYALLAMDSFMRTARSVLMMGSKLQPGGAVIQSAFAVLFLICLFIVGAALIVSSVRHIIASLKK